MQKRLFRKLLVIGIVILFVGVAVLPSIPANHRIISPSKPLMTGNTLYVGGSGPGNYTTIQSAVNAANPGDTIFVYSGTYFENVEVYTNSITLVGENKYTTIIDGGGTLSVVYVSSVGVIISGFTMQHGSFGIALLSSSNNITGNNVLNNKYGIYLSSSSNNNITSNNINSSNHVGIHLSSSSNNNIIGNTISFNENYGIHLINSPNTLMRNNIIQNSKRSFGIIGGSISNFYQDIDTTNTIDGKPIYYLVEQSNIVFDESMSLGFIGLISCNNISVKNLIITNNNQGVLLVNTSYSTIYNLHLYNNYMGIHLLHSSNNNTIKGNNASNNKGGMALIKSNNNTIMGNKANSNTYDGILVYHSNNNVIIGNNLSSNSNNGINFQSSSNNNIFTGNNVLNNGNGISLYSSSNNNITGNNISTNNLYGIYLYSSDNTILKNNFLRNTRHVLFKKCTNTWEQNYWGRPRIFPKLIFGTIEIKLRERLWFNIDWRPAQEPYDIG